MNLTAVFPHLTLLGLLAMTPLFAEEAPVPATAPTSQQLTEQLIELQTENAALTQRAAALDEQISAERERPMPEKAAFEQAAKTLATAKSALMETPSVANNQRVEKARFAYLMAERKYRRANQQLVKIEQQRRATEQRIATNAEHIDKLERQQRERQQQAKREQDAKQVASQQEQAAQQRRLQAKKAKQKQEAELNKARAQHAAAMAEIKRLKAKLAPTAAAANAKKSNAPGAKKSSKSTAKVAATTRKPSKATRHKYDKSKHRASTHRSNGDQAAEQRARTIAKRSKSKKVAPKLDRAQWIRGGREHYWALLKAASDDRSRRPGNNKLLQVKTYQGDRLLKQTSHSLKPLGNQVYQAKSIVRAGRTEFIIDGKRWAHRVPPSSNKDPFVFVLDARRAGEPQLLLFAKSDVD